VRFIPSSIPEVLIVEPDVHRDNRGFFVETYHADRYRASGIAPAFVQDNHTRSVGGTIRGLHMQRRRPQAKLVRVLAGEIFDVAVDIRRSSPSFGKWEGARLSAQSKNMLWVPAGFAHGFYVLTDSAEVLYKATDFYAPGHERCILWNDPELKIDWPLSGEPLISPKDAAGAHLKNAEVFP
jgi:dTDP-4-dehydrorhamnose 3,5-epimerase